VSAPEPTPLVVCSGEIAAPLALVWDLVSDFGRVDRWSAGAVTCTVEGSGPGAIRTVSAPDRKVRERLVACDPIGHRISYSFVDTLPVSVEDLVCTIAITGDTTASVIRWSATGTVAPGDRGAVADTFRHFFDRRIGELQVIAARLAHDVRVGAPGRG